MPNLAGLTAVTLLRLNELHATVTMPVTLLVDERLHPSAGLTFADKRPAGVVGSVLGCSEQRFLVGLSSEALGHTLPVW